MINYRLATIPKRIIILLTVLFFSVGGVYISLCYVGKRQAVPVVQSFLQKWQDVFQISYKSLSWEPLAQRIILKDVVLCQKGNLEPLTKIKRVALQIKQKNGQLLSLHAVLKKMKIDTHSDPVEGKNNFLSELGYQELEGTVTFDYEFFPEIQAASFSIDGQGKKWGAFETAFELENFNPTSDIVFDYPTIVVRKVSLSFEDKGFVSRLVAVLARQEGLSRHFYVEDFKRSFLSEEDPPPVWKQHFVTFLGAPQYFSIDFTAQKRLTLAEIMSTWPDVVKTNDTMVVSARSESTSLTEWCEAYFNKIRQEFFSKNG